MGGLGNQLFQVFTVIAAAIRNNDTFFFMNYEILPGNPGHPRYTHWSTLFRGLRQYLTPSNNVTDKMFQTLPRWDEIGFHYTPVPADTVKYTKPLRLHGYFQSEKYFTDKYARICEMMQLSQDDGSYPTMKLSAVNYLPGVEGFGYPKGIGGFLMPRKGAYFFKDIHYGPATKDLRDSSKLNIWFTDEKPKRITYEMQMGTLGISFIEPALVIPPNEVKRFKTQLTITGDLSMLTINPHMHLLGTKFWAYAIKPDGDTIPLIRINKWDFRWQYFYTFKKMLHLPKGTTIYAWGEFDNTINNPLNPNHPPKTVSENKGSMRTSDEMFQFIITYHECASGTLGIDIGKFRRQG
jgi:hypothetical protein